MLVISFGEKALVATKGGLGDDFKDAAGGDFHKARVIGPRRTGAAFGDVGRDGDGGATHLVGQAEAFFVREAAGELINKVRKRNGVPPGIELFKVEHGSKEWC